jgi:hypothetical protein
MTHQYARYPILLPAIAATLLVMGSMPATLAGTPEEAASAPALPGGAVISARSAMAVPVAGGKGVATPIGSDGAFKFVGLKPRQSYRVAITSTTVPRQTQGTTFGEKVNAGLATKHTAKINDSNGGMPNRISMNVTVARRSLTVDVDGAPIEVAVDPDGSLVGRVAAL